MKNGIPHFEPGDIIVIDDGKTRRASIVSRVIYNMDGTLAGVDTIEDPTSEREEASPPDG